jgi:hypothetical protein
MTRIRHKYLCFCRYLTCGSGSPVPDDLSKSGCVFHKSLNPRVRIRVTHGCTRALPYMVTIGELCTDCTMASAVTCVAIRVRCWLALSLNKLYYGRDMHAVIYSVPLCSKICCRPGSAWEHLSRGCTVASFCKYWISVINTQYLSGTRHVSISVASACVTIRITVFGNFQNKYVNICILYQFMTWIQLIFHGSIQIISKGKRVFCSVWYLEACNEAGAWWLSVIII